MALTAQHNQLPFERSLLIENDDALDATICVLSGADFLQGITIEPKTIRTAQKEG